MLSSDSVFRLMIATTSKTAGSEIASAINLAENMAAQMPIAIAAAIVATNVSQTLDFAALAVGDQVLMIPATAGNADLITIGTAGNLGQAAVVGNIYVALRPFSLATAKLAAATTPNS